MSDSIIITGSQYNVKGIHKENLIDPNKYNLHPAYLYAKKLLSETEWRPDHSFVLDICETKEHNFYLLEIGCFSCAGLYANDVALAVKAVSKAAEREFKSYQEIA